MIYKSLSEVMVYVTLDRNLLRLVLIRVEPYSQHSKILQLHVGLNAKWRCNKLLVVYEKKLL